MTNKQVSLDALLEACASEPIHVPGSIQPYGLLLVLDPGTWVVRAASANAAEHLGVDEPGRSLVGRPLAALVGPGGATVITALAAQRGDVVVVGGPVTGLLGGAFEAALHEIDGLLVLEMIPEPAFRTGGAHTEGQETLRIENALERMRLAPGEAALCGNMAEEIRALTGFDRVMVYRFDEDWNGEVLAERRAPGADSYDGLHFPASDIPAQARALYVRNRTRLIADAHYVPVPIEPATLTGDGPLDMSQSVLRSVSPVHLEYLRNMGVRASMSVSIVRDGVLWGLVACHHGEPRVVAYRTRAACAVLAQVFAILLERRQSAEDERGRDEQRARVSRLVEGMLRTDSVADGLALQADELLLLAGASGAALVTSGEVKLVGETPTEADVRALGAWASERFEDGVYATDALSRHFPPAHAYGERASGLLAISLGLRGGDAVLWFRSEQPQTVYWAGAPEKAIRFSGDGEGDGSGDGDSLPQLHPRASFEAWRSVLRGRARPWRPEEVGVARELRATIFSLVYERFEETRRLNELLRASNETLETRNRELLDFAYVASHDLREPVRKLRTFAHLLLHEHGADLPERARFYLDRMDVTSERLTHAVADLLTFSRVVTHGDAFADVDLGRVVALALEDLDLLAAEAGARVDAGGPWPTVKADPAQLGQLVRLLVENALQFRHPERAPHVRVRAGAEGGGVQLVVEDNGMGMAPQHTERIFRPFERLRASEASTSTGMGLSIARRIAERHGGTIEARSTLGEGTAFEVRLPQLHAAPGR